MKSLDEVIEIFEKVVKHDYVWFDEKTALMTIETLTDSLQYLRELRDITDIPMEYFESGGTLQNLADTSQITCPKCHSEFVILDDPDGDHQQLLKCQALLQDFYRNDPLTWNELKEMEGKPVWLEYNFQIGDKEFRDKSKRWCIIGEFKPWHDTEITITENGFVLSKREQINSWKAYRKERS